MPSLWPDRAADRCSERSASALRPPRPAFCCKDPLSYAMRASWRSGQALGSACGSAYRRSAILAVSAGDDGKIEGSI